MYHYTPIYYYCTYKQSVSLYPYLLLLHLQSVSLYPYLLLLHLQTKCIIIPLPTTTALTNKVYHYTPTYYYCTYKQSVSLYPYLLLLHLQTKCIIIPLPTTTALTKCIVILLPTTTALTNKVYHYTPTYYYCTYKQSVSLYPYLLLLHLQTKCIIIPLPTTTALTNKVYHYTPTYYYYTYKQSKKNVVGRCLFALHHQGKDEHKGEKCRHKQQCLAVNSVHVNQGFPTQHLYLTNILSCIICIL